MATEISENDWEHLTEIMSASVKLIEGRDMSPVRVGILHFHNMATMLGLEDLAAVAGKLEAFALRNLAPDWNENAAAVLSFAMESICEEMKARPYGTAFVSSMREIVVYLDFFSDDTPAARDETPAEPAEADPPDPEPPEAEPEPAPPDAVDEPSTIELSPADFLLPSDVPGKTGPVVAPPIDNATVAREEPRPQDEDASGPIIFEVPEEDCSREADRKGSSEEAEHSAGSPADAPPSIVEPAPAVEPEPLIEPERGFEPEAESTGVHMPPSSPLPEETDSRVAGYRRLLKHDPRSQVFIFQAEALCLQKSWKEAAETCRRGLVFHPHDLRGRVLLGWALWELGQSEEAREVLIDAAKEMEKNAVLYRVLAEITRDENPGAADRYMELYQRLDPAFRTEPTLNGALEAKRVENSAPVKFARDLLGQFRRGPGEAAGRLEIFSDLDRRQLANLLKGESHT